MALNRVSFFSKEDLSITHNLELAEQRIQELRVGAFPTDLAGIIELWHIRKFFEEDLRLKKWSDTDFATLEESTKGYKGAIAKYFCTINYGNIYSEYISLDWNYRESFWKIISAFGFYSKINKDFLKKITLDNPYDLRSVLSCEKLVDKNKGIIREVLLQSESSAVILLDKYVGNRSLNALDIFLPSSLTIEDKEAIILKFLDSDNVNLRYVRLITQAKDITGEFVLSTRTRYRAIILEEKLNDKLLKNPRTTIVHNQFAIEFREDTADDLKALSYEDGYPLITYSKKHITEGNNIFRVLFCAFGFEWLNDHFMLNLINKNCEVDAFEYSLSDKSKSSYPNYSAFEHKNELAILQTKGYCDLLSQIDTSFESELSDFYHIELNATFGYPGLSMTMPKSSDGWLQKCRILFPNLDYIATQYNAYIEDDVIDYKYIALKKPQKMTEVKSLLVKKYCEANCSNDSIKKIMFFLFSPGALLHVVESSKGNPYHSFAQLMDNESVSYDSYNDFQKQYIDYLIDNGIISIGGDGNIVYVKKSLVDVLKIIWEFGYVSYWHINDIGRTVIDEMLEKNWLIADDHLLSKPERDYFSFYTDNAAFTNGYAYRNHYAHGTNPPEEDEKAHQEAYFVLLRLVTILIIKMYDDLRLSCKSIALAN